jgi:putative iron-regulated protein
MRSSVQAAEAIPAPFDRAILPGNPGRAKIEATIQSLTAQSDQIVAAAAAVGIQKLTLVQP